MSTMSTDTITAGRFESVTGWTNTVADRVRAYMGTVEFRILAVVLTLVAAVGAAIAVFGYPALIITALIMVPVIFTVLMLITVGK